MFEKDDDIKDPDWKNKEIMLSNIAVGAFESPADWRSEEAVITFLTMKDHLYDQWELQCKKTNTYKSIAEVEGKPVPNDKFAVLYSHSDFDADEIKAPGITLDGQYFEDERKVDESYTVIVPQDFLTEEIIKMYLKRLNAKFDRQFYLEDTSQAEREKDFYRSQVVAKLDKEPENLDEILDAIYGE